MRFWTGAGGRDGGGVSAAMPASGRTAQPNTHAAAKKRNGARTLPVFVHVMPLRRVSPVPAELAPRRSIGANMAGIWNPRGNQTMVRAIFARQTYHPPTVEG